MAATVKERILLHANVYTVLSPPEQRDVDKLAEVIAYFTKEQVWQLVAAAGGRPMLCSYSSYGTPHHGEAAVRHQFRPS